MSTDTRSDRVAFDIVAEEFVECLRRGEHPSAEEFAERYPDLADEIQELFPAIETMEFGKPSNGPLSGSGSVPERLGDFRIVREVGRGGMGVVYEATQESLGRRVAVKVLPNVAGIDARRLRRFEHEARTAAALHHTNIVQVFGVGHQDNCHYYVMQFIEGAGLDRVLSLLEQSTATSKRSSVGEIVQILAASGSTESWTNTQSSRVDGDPSTTPVAATVLSDLQEDLPAPSLSDHQTATVAGEATRGDSYWRTVAEIGVQVADALAYAHSKGVLHRDIKPANLIIDTQGVVWVADFGLAKAFEDDRVSRTGELLGTIAYMAPEQFQGVADGRSDVYSLGLTLYELLTLRNAFPEKIRAQLLKSVATQQPAPPRRIRPDIPRDLETIVLKAIASEPQGRYQSAQELAADLRRFLDNRPIQAQRATTIEQILLWRRRNPIVANLSAVTALLLVAVAATASAAYVNTSRALARERTERRKAEDARELAVVALDRIFERHTPTPYGPVVDNKPLPIPTAETAETLEDLLTFYDQLAELEEVDGKRSEKYLKKQALAHLRIGGIWQHVQERELAQVAYRRSLELYDQLLKINPDETYTYERASVFVELGIVDFRSGEEETAIEDWKQALALLSAEKVTGDRSEMFDSLSRRTQAFIDWGPHDPRTHPHEFFPVGPYAGPGQGGHQPPWGPGRMGPRGRRTPEDLMMEQLFGPEPPSPRTTEEEGP